MTDEEREQARAERRDVIDSNKAWDSAEPVRREWLTQFVTRKAAPKGTGQFIAHVLTQHSHVVSSVDGDHLAAEWFGLPAAQYGMSTGWEDLIKKGTEQRAQVIALGRLLASLEKSLSRQSWRNPGTTTIRYLTFLGANGYGLSDVERRAAGQTASE